MLYDKALEAMTALRLTAEEKVLFEAAAKRQGIGLSQWLRRAGHKMLTAQVEGDIELLRLILGPAETTA